MCRIIAITGKADKEFLAGALTQFGGLAETGVVPPNKVAGHKDGWGIVAYGSNDRIIVYEKEPKSATHNAHFEASVAKAAAAKPALLIAHLRKASIGNNILENTQPYAYENFSFCHNGTIKDFKNFSLSEEFLRLRNGTSDSEWIFYYLIQEIRKNPALSLEAFFKNFIGRIRPLDYTAFNILFSDGNYLFAIREANEKNEWVKKENLCEYYYTLFMGKSADQKVKIICSQKLDLGGIVWNEIPNHTIAIIDLHTGQEKILPV